MQDSVIATFERGPFVAIVRREEVEKDGRKFFMTYLDLKRRKPDGLLGRQIAFFPQDDADECVKDIVAIVEDACKTAYKDIRRIFDGHTERDDELARRHNAVKAAYEPVERRGGEDDDEVRR